ncbi:MAG TPA: ABC transporter permease [Candidatus Synoicihabitans sp.]|nr:ABC transporter permease [Candidatus Synoicihabitans sp.]
MNSLLQDLVFGFRTLNRNRGFTAVALATLAIGIGGNTAIFSFVDAVLLRPLPYPEPERIVRVLEKRPDGGRNGIATLNYLDWARENTVFEALAAQAGGAVTLTGIDEPVQLRGARVTAQYFDVFGVRAALGRTFLPGEDQLGQHHVVVLGHDLWQTQFGGDPAIVGRVIRLDGEPHTVVGVLPRGGGFDRGSYLQLWRPLAFAPENLTRNFHWFGAYARLKPGTTLEQARAEMETIGTRIAQEYPDIKKGWSVSVDAYAETAVGDQLRRSLYVLLAAVGMVLLIACANLASLSLARGLAREREVAIRASLGAGRGRLIRQFLTESVLLALIGGGLGLALGVGLMLALRAALPPFALPREAEVTLDARVLLFTLGISLLTGVVCGLFPALQATRPDLAAAMKQGSAGAGTGRLRHGVRTALVVTEVALAFVLLTGAGLLLRSFARLQAVPTGFDSTNVITAGLPISERQYPTPEALHAYLQRVTEAIATVPGVRDAAISSALPLRGWGYGMPFHRADSAVSDRAARRACFFKMVSPSYFRTLGISVLRGRALEERDRAGGPRVAVINEAMAKKHFPNEDPIGKRLMVEQILYGQTGLGPDVAWEIVGVIADERVDRLDAKEPSIGMYVSIEQSPQPSQALIVRGAIDPAIQQQSIRKAVLAVNPDQTLPDLKTLDQIKTESLGDTRLRSMLLGIFGLIALLLAAIGIYGVVAYGVEQRTREFGIRAALGASPGAILKFVLRGGLTTVTLGLLIGVAGVLALTRLLSSLLYGVGERDPVTLVAVAGILGVVALVACYLPARRATRVDPIIALQSD